MDLMDLNKGILPEALDIAQPSNFLIYVLPISSIVIRCASAPTLVVHEALVAHRVDRVGLSNFRDIDTLSQQHRGHRPGSFEGKVKGLVIPNGSGPDRRRSGHGPLLGMPVSSLLPARGWAMQVPPARGHRFRTAHA
jgi:hypothetical protein